MSASDHSHNGNRVSLATLGHRLESMPMLLISILVAIGIVIADNVVLPFYGVLATMLCCIGILWLSRASYVRWCYLAVAIIAFGYIVAELRAPKATTPYDYQCDMVVSVDGIPAQRDGYRIADGHISAWHDGIRWHEADNRVQLWIRSDSIEHGSIAHITSKLQSRISRHSGYNELLYRRGYVGGVGINDYNISAIEQGDFEGMQHWTVQKLGYYHSDSAAHATLEAMVAGSRANLTPTLREAYSRTGLAHLMAVSGLHLGIVLIVVSMLLAPLRLVHRGHRAIHLLVIIALWLFAYMSGASPSVIRAAIMLTTVELSLISSLRFNPINMLATAIFLMLVYRPNYLFDISFELSATAVFGIVAWGIPLLRTITTRHFVGSSLLSTLIVGVVASLWTLPIISHSFGNIPLVGVVLTPIVMVFCYVIIGGGILALILPSVLSTPFIAIAEWAGEMQNNIVLWASEWPFAAIDYRLSESGVAICYALFAIITAVGWSINRKKSSTFALKYDTNRT